jgi:hypothetical protein
MFEFLKLPAGDEPYLEGLRCRRCGATYLGSRLACARCLSRDGLDPVALARTGTLYAYSIVHQSLPGVPTPYVSAIVDLDGGGTAKANLREVEPDPARLPFRLPVELVTFAAPGRDADGNEVVAFGFRPRTKRAASGREGRD